MAQKILEQSDGTPTAWRGSSNGEGHTRLTSSVHGAHQNTEHKIFAYSGTAAAVGTTTDVTIYGLPYVNLKFVKSATSDTVTLTCGVNGSGKVVIKISGLSTETIQVTGLVDGTVETDPLPVKNTSGTVSAAATLGNGTYILVTE